MLFSGAKPGTSLLSFEISKTTVFCLYLPKREPLKSYLPPSAATRNSVEIWTAFGFTPKASAITLINLVPGQRFPGT